jgi:hypothetical protein
MPVQIPCRISAEVAGWYYVGGIPLFEGSLNVQIFNDLIKESPKKNFCEEAKIIQIMSTNRYHVKILYFVT